MLRKTAMFLALALALVVLARGQQLGSYNLGAAWLYPQGAYTIVIDDGPGPMTKDILTMLQGRNVVGYFFQVSCHYLGQTADPRSSICRTNGSVPLTLLDEFKSSNQCVGNHTRSHLVLPTLSATDLLTEIGEPLQLFPSFLSENCRLLLVPPGLRWNQAVADQVNEAPEVSGKQQGPIGQDFDGSGIIGNDIIAQDQDCMTKGYGVEACTKLYLDAMNSADYGGIVSLHDYNPFAKNPDDPTDPVSGYALELVRGILDGCPGCTFLPATAVPGIRGSASVTQFAQTSDPTDNLSDRIAPVVVGDVNGDGRADVLVPRSDGIYCGITWYNGRQFPLYRCLAFGDGSIVAADRYWLADIDGDGKPYLAWIDAGRGLLGAKWHDGNFGSEVKLLSPHFAARYGGRYNPEYKSSLRFGIMRKGISIPDAVAITSQDVVLFPNMGNGTFGAPVPIVALETRLTATPRSAGTTLMPTRASQNLLLADVNGDGLPDIVIVNGSTLMYSLNRGEAGFGALVPLADRNNFSEWATPLAADYYAALTVTELQGRTAIVGWAPNGFSYLTVGKAGSARGSAPKIMQTGWLCNDCYVSLPGWLAWWRQSTTSASANNFGFSESEVGFADFWGNGTALPWLVWAGGFYTAPVITTTGMTNVATQ